MSAQAQSPNFARLLSLHCSRFFPKCDLQLHCPIWHPLATHGYLYLFCFISFQIIFNMCIYLAISGSWLRGSSVFAVSGSLQS